MRSIPRLAAAVAVGLGLAVVAAAASGQELGGTVELGATRTPVAPPVCPANVSSSNCTIILTRVTAFATVRDGVSFPTRVRHAGLISAFTVGLSELASSKSTQSSFIQYLNATYGGPARAGITVLRWGPWKRGKHRWTVVANSPMYLVQPYLGSVARIPLAKPIQVVPGETIALTTPTWAPVLSIDVSRKQFSYRQSRVWNCSKPPQLGNQAQLQIGKTTDYNCNYPGTRPEYSATEELYPLGTSPQS